jgi:hypothetical protein
LSHFNAEIFTPCRKFFPYRLQSLASRAPGGITVNRKKKGPTKLNYSMCLTISNASAWEKLKCYMFTYIKSTCAEIQYING